MAETNGHDGKPAAGTPAAGAGNGNGGGNGGVQYSSACLANATQLSTYHAMVFRELMR